MSVQKCKRETTSSEFIKWIVYLDMMEEKKLTTITPDQYYLAQIAQVIAQTVSSKKTIRLKQFLIPFALKKKEKRDKKLSAKEKLKRIKASWFAAVGLNRKK